MPPEERPSPQLESTINFEIVEPKEGTVRTYANFSHLSWSGMDITIQLYHLEQPNRELPAYTKSPNRLINTASVTLTWAAAKTFHKSLGEILERYEKVYGPIDTDFKEI